MRESDNEIELRETFAGALALVDAGVETVVGQLHSGGMYSSSVLVLVSDNGGMVKNGGSNWPLRGEKTTLFEVKPPLFLVRAMR